MLSAFRGSHFLHYKTQRMENAFVSLTLSSLHLALRFVTLSRPISLSLFLALCVGGACVPKTKRSGGQSISFRLSPVLSPPHLLVSSSICFSFVSAHQRLSFSLPTLSLQFSLLCSLESVFVTANAQRPKDWGHLAICHRRRKAPFHKIFTYFCNFGLNLKPEFPIWKYSPLIN